MDGSATYWYENGQKKEEKNYKDSKVDGLLITWDENGEEIYRRAYKIGKRVLD